MAVPVVGRWRLRSTLKTPLALLCPAWKTWGTATTVKPNTIILHSRQDDVIPFADSEELLANSGLPPEKLAELLSKDTWTYAEASQLLEHI